MQDGSCEVLPSGSKAGVQWRDGTLWSTIEKSGRAARISFRKLFGDRSVPGRSGLEGDGRDGLLVMLLLSQSASSEGQLAECRCEIGGDGVADSRGYPLASFCRSYGVAPWPLC